MAMASQGQPSRKQPSGPLLRHFLQPMQRMGSTAMRPKGVLSSSGAQYMQSATGQYSTHAGDPAHPVQHSLMMARMCGLRLRCVVVPVDFGSYFTTDPALNSSMLGAPYAIKILHEWAAVSYSCRHRTCCQSGRFETFLKCFLFAGGTFYWLPGGAGIG